MYGEPGTTLQVKGASKGHLMVQGASCGLLVGYTTLEGILRSMSVP